MSGYNDIPDAPWIREAEVYGMPEAETIYCPICGAEDPEDLWTDSDGEVVGCECCLKRVDAYDFIAEMKRRGA